MKAEDLRLEELITFEEGNLSLYGRRLALHSIHAFAKFRNDLINTVGFEYARKLFTRFGYFWGQADAAGMKRILKWNDITELLKAGGRLHSLQGVTPVTYDKFEYDAEAGKLLMEVTWKDSIEAEEHLTEIGWAKQPICWKLVGYASGYATFCLNKPVYFVEKQCRAKGDNICTAVGKDIDSWGDEIYKYLPYFEAEDIKAEVLALTDQLQKKMEALDRQKVNVKRLRHRMDKYFLEFRSKQLNQLFTLADRVAEFDSSIIITGETGVGKEVLARYIHGNSHRSKGPFVAINCAALPDSLLESELFGHKAGAFTGAVRDKIGMFEKADKGTVLLDEIAEISPATQIKILRVLQEKEIVRLGESMPRKIDVRVISATNKDLTAYINEDKFREDLLYRLRVIELNIPPLRDRREDILPLARYIVSNLAKQLNIPGLRIEARAIDYLMAYSWPGNVRELANVLERGAVLSTEGVITAATLPTNLRRDIDIFRSDSDAHSSTLEQVEKKYIEFVLGSTGGNKTRAAKILGISLSTLWRKLRD